MICVIKLRKYKNKEFELTDKQKKKFSKISGFLMIFFLLTICNILARAILISTAPDITDIWNRRIIIIQSLVNFAVYIWIDVVIFKKGKEAPKKIQKIIIEIGIFNLIASIIQRIYTICTSNLTDLNGYYIESINTITSVILNTLIWTTYFKVSKRVSVYFKK